MQSISAMSFFDRTLEEPRRREEKKSEEAIKDGRFERFPIDCGSRGGWRNVPRVIYVSDGLLNTELLINEVRRCFLGFDAETYDSLLAFLWPQKREDFYPFGNGYKLHYASCILGRGKSRESRHTSRSSKKDK